MVTPTLSDGTLQGAAPIADKLNKVIGLAAVSWMLQAWLAIVVPLGAWVRHLENEVPDINRSLCDAERVGVQPPAEMDSFDRLGQRFAGSG